MEEAERMMNAAGSLSSAVEAAREQLQNNMPVEMPDG